MNTQVYVSQLDEAMSAAADVEIAAQQMAYMKGQFEYYGIKTPLRREILKPFLIKATLPAKEELEALIKMLWAQPQRDFQMFGLDLSMKYLKELELKDLELLEYMITHKPWWDTVDMVASHLVGQYFRLYPEERDAQVERWMESGNIWLQRTCLLFQLKYKDQLDNELLADLIGRLLGSDEFFINKAIGWVLREYGKTNPEWMIDYANRTNLSTLSRKEALRLIL